MPRPRPPPTPLTSTDITAQEIPCASDPTSDFTLPPPAIQSINAKTSSESSKPLTTANMQRSPPQSPEDRRTGSSVQRKRTLSGSAKAAPEQNTMQPATHSQNNTLPPPPTRARKIIQMKPKQSSTLGQEQQANTQTSPVSSKQSSGSSTSSNPKRGKQPSATSAAGRKIARKTAHSIIERRRRSKMNEEFGVLKDMIPACAGIEMHKLAILQAGIEYLRYLEGCIEKLKGQDSNCKTQTEEEDEVEDDESMEVDCAADVRAARGPSPSVVSEQSSITDERSARAQTQSQSVSHSHRASSIVTSSTNSTYASPDLRPTNFSASISTSSHYSNRLPPPMNYIQQQQQQQQQQRQNFIIPSAYSISSPSMTATAPLQTGVSPAFNGFHLSPDLTRTSTWGSAYGNNGSVGKPSPHILPLPQAALPLPQILPQAGEGHAEATATAALMMLTNDRRASVSMVRSSSGKGMSVKDLLSS